jgi:hypothetical protein
MKYLKNWKKFFEQADSPDLVGKFSPEEIKGMTKADSPFKEPYKRFRHQLFSGPASVDLNMSMSDAMRKRFGGTYGIAEMLYHKIIKEIPQFKNFECNTGYEHEKDYALHFKKEKEIEKKKGYTASIEMWVQYRAKLEPGDSYLGYKKGKIKLLFVTHINKIQKDNNLFNMMKEPKNPKDPGEESTSPINQLFNMNRNPLSDQYIEPTPEEQKEEDELWNKAIDNMYKNMRGDVDDEDLHYYERLKVSYTNLSVESFLKKLPKIKQNLEIYEKYLQNKYQFTL